MSDDSAALCRAALGNDPEAVRVLLAGGADPNDESEGTPLCAATV